MSFLLKALGSLAGGGLLSKAASFVGNIGSKIPIIGNAIGSIASLFGGGSSSRGGSSQIK